MCLSENGPDKKIPLIRHFFNSSTFSLHLIFCALGDFLCPGWVAQKVVKTWETGVSTWTLVLPCHALSLGRSSLTEHYLILEDPETGPQLSALQNLNFLIS